jgi:hypothetical protein
VIDNTAGAITFNANSLIGPGPGAFGAGSLLRVQFVAVAPGTSIVAPSINLSDGDGLFDSSLFFIGFQTTGGEVTVASTSVPEASTLLLLSVGFMALQQNDAGGGIDGQQQDRANWQQIPIACARHHGATITSLWNMGTALGAGFDCRSADGSRTALQRVSKPSAASAGSGNF